MKNFLKLFALFACFATLFAACSSDETVDDYTPEVKSFETYDMVAGSEKIYVTWTVPNDESITGTKISWSGSTKGSHSISDLTANDQMEYTITDLKDGGTYTVTIESLVGGYVGTGSAFVSGLAVYGPSTYAKVSLPTLGEITHDGTDATVTWTQGGDSNVGVDVTYTDVNGLTASAIALFDASGAATTNLIKAQEGTYFTSNALFQPVGGYDYAEIALEGDFFIASGELTAATPEISNTLGGKGQIKFSWSVTDNVTKSTIQLYAVGAESDTATGDLITISNLADITTENVATYTTSLAAGVSYKVEITNYIDINGTSTATQAIMSETTMFVYSEDMYAAPSITSVVNDRGTVTISWDLSGDKVIASDMLRIELYYVGDEDDSAQIATYDSYDAPLILTAAKSNTSFTAKAFFRPENSIEGTDTEVEKVIDVTTEASNEGEIPAPILYAPANMVLTPGFDGTDSYVLITWDALTGYDLDEAANINLYIQQGNKDNILDGTAIPIDKNLSEYKYGPLTVSSDNNYYWAVLTTVNGDGDESEGTTTYVVPYNADTYASKTLSASIVRSGENNADATITWAWTKTTDVAVEVTEYTKVDGSTSSVEKTKYEDATTTTITGVKGGSEVKYSSYYCPTSGGVDSLAVVQTPITVPNLVIADVPTLTLKTGVGESLPFIQVSWDSFDYTNVSSAKLYYKVPSADTYDSIDVSYETLVAGVATIPDLTAGAVYNVRMALIDDDLIEKTPLDDDNSPSLYTAATYTDAAAVTISSESGSAIYNGSDLTIILDLADASEELVGVIVSYELAEGTDATSTSGSADYVIAGESIPTTLVLEGIKADSEYVITPYYRPSTGVTAVAGGVTTTLVVPAKAPTVAAITAVVSSYNKSDNGAEPEITVSWTLANDDSRDAVKDNKMYVYYTAEDDSDAVQEIAVTDSESYSVTLNNATHEITAGKTYTIYVATADSQGYEYSSNVVSSVKAYNGASYTADNLPTITAEYDSYTSSVYVKWDATSLDADLSTMSATYNAQTEVVDLTTGSYAFAYSSSATTASVLAGFKPAAVTADDAITASYGETVDVASGNVNVVTMSYDILLDGGVYKIFTAEGLVAFAGVVNGTAATTTPSVATNITDWTQNTAATGSVVGNINLTDVTWTPITGYEGTFDGGNGSSYSISNLTINATTTNQGLFATLTSGAVVKNVTLSNVSITSSVNIAGAIAGTATGATITDCTVESGTITGSTNIGGLVGVNYRTSIIDCVNSAAIVSTNTGNSTTAGVGGIVGTLGVNSATDVDATQRTMIQNCTNNGTITTDAAYVGGVAGSIYCHSTAAYGYTVTGCTNNGAINTTTGPAGGMAGYMRSDAAGLILVTQSTNNGTITTAAVNTGGIVGYTTAVGVEVSYCTNSKSATVTCTNTGNGYTGGIGGQMAGGSILSNSNNYADIIGLNGVGGVIGNKNGAASSVSYCNNEGNVTGTSNVGGIAGTGAAPLTGDSSSYNYNSGTVKGTSNVGGLVGNNTGTITYYRNTGYVYISDVDKSYNNGLIGTGTGEVTYCDNYFVSSAAEAVSSVAAYPTYASDPDSGDISKIMVSWSFGEGVTSLANATTVNVYYKSSEAEVYSVEPIAVSTGSMTTSASITVDANDTYSIYVTTATSDNIETLSDVTSSSPLSIDTYNSSSYDNKVPVVESITNDGTNVTINWSADSLDDDLVSISLTYGSDVATTILKADLTTTTIVYNSEVQAFSYISTFKPAKYADNESVASVATTAISVEIPSQPAEALASFEAYPTYVAGDESDTSTINVSWAYGDVTTNIANTVVYYKKSTADEYDEVILTGTTDTSYSLGAENETIDANATYNVYVTTRNSDTIDTAVSDDTILEIATYNSSSYDAKMPEMTVVNNSDSGLVIISWNEESIDADLSKVTISYDGVDGDIVVTDFSGNTTFTYSSSYTTFTYTATFKPAAYAANESVASVVVTPAEATTIPDASTVDAAEAVTAAAAVNSTTDGITVTWTYGDDKANISKVVVYYKASGDETYASKSVSGNEATSLTLTSADGIEAGAIYYIYVETENILGTTTASNLTTEALAEVVVGTLDIELVDGTYEIATPAGLVAFAGIVNGSYTATTPSVLSNVTDWAQNLGANAKLVASFSLSTVCGEGNSWTSIGSSNNDKYTGKFDGDNNTISDLYISSASQYQGLVGFTDGAEISNVKLSNVNITVSTSNAPHSAALVGYLTGGKISNCKILSGSVTSASTAGNAVFGAIVGMLNGGEVDGCTNYATVTAKGQGVGGIAGYMYNTATTIKNCTNYGEIVAESAVDGYGGIAGLVTTSGYTATIEGCNNYGVVRGSASYVGGILGKALAGTISISTSNNHASITGAANVGGIAGSAIDGTTLVGDVTYYSYNNGAVTGTSNVGAIVGNNAGTISYYKNTGLVTPSQLLVGTGTAASDTCADEYTAGGSTGGDDDTTTDIELVSGTYNIYTAEGLVAFASIVNSGLTADEVAALDTNSTITGAVAVNAAASAKLMADITLTEAWTPMGSGNATVANAVAYTGSFDGDSKVISGLVIENTGAYRGFFSYVSGATIKNVTIDTPDVEGAGCSGILVGETAIDDTNPSLISNCHIIGGTLAATAKHVGAIVGCCSSATITGCSNSATLTGGQENMAGIAGTLYYGTAYVEHCINTGAITSGKRAGGIVGNVSANGGTHIVNHCTNKGAITGSSTYNGGIVGYCTRNIYYSANEGSVSGNTGGGIAGGTASGYVVNGSQTVAEDALKTDAPTSGLAYGAGGNYSKGEVTGTTVGALVGTNAATLSNYVNYSSLTGLEAYVGTGNGTVTNCTTDTTDDSTDEDDESGDSELSAGGSVGDLNDGYNYSNAVPAGDASGSITDLEDDATYTNPTTLE